LLKETANARVISFAASDSRTAALEDANPGHGMFSHALIGGLNGAADLLKDNKIHLFELASYVSSAVPRLSNQHQFPEIDVRGADFVLAQLPP
jgi:uncharacterized caspase-like protein